MADLLHQELRETPIAFRSVLAGSLIAIQTKQELVVWAVRNGLLDEVEVSGDAQPAPEEGQ